MAECSNYLSGEGKHYQVARLNRAELGRRQKEAVHPYCDY